MLPRIILLDRQTAVVNAWKFYFNNLPDIQFINDNFQTHTSDIIVSPANSFGFMNGGIDHWLSMFFGEQIQDKVQNSIKSNFGGELLVGQALIVPTDNNRYPYLISAPTMRLPKRIMDPADIFLATRAALRLAVLHQNTSSTQISIMLSGMGTGAGAIEPEICAEYMRKAYDAVYVGESFPLSSEEGLKTMYGPRK